VLTKPDRGFGLKDPMPYGRIDEWVILIKDNISPDFGTAMKSE